MCEVSSVTGIVLMAELCISHCPIAMNRLIGPPMCFCNGIDGFETLKKNASIKLALLGCLAITNHQPYTGLKSSSSPKGAHQVSIHEEPQCSLVFFSGFIISNMSENSWVLKRLSSDSHYDLKPKCKMSPLKYSRSTLTTFEQLNTLPRNSTGPFLFGYTTLLDILNRFRYK
jgi:hypothetical protein